METGTDCGWHAVHGMEALPWRWNIAAASLGYKDSPGFSLSFKRATREKTRESPTLILGINLKEPTTA